MDKIEYDSEIVRIDNIISEAEDIIEALRYEKNDLELKEVSRDYESLDEAHGWIREAVWNVANQWCGEEQTGDDEYYVPFSVSGVDYMGTVEVEYNRHDKRFYYIDGTWFTYKKL